MDAPRPANALNQGLTAGANAAGAATTFADIPYFFSDQYDMGMEYSGWPCRGIGSWSR